MFSQEQWGQLLANFIEEAKELIQQAEAALLELDDGHDDLELLNALFRAVHTLKGSAGLFSLDDFVAFTHHQESLIMRVRDNGNSLSREQISALLSGLDILSDELELLSSGSSPSPLLEQHAPSLLCYSRWYLRMQTQHLCLCVSRSPLSSERPIVMWL